MSTKKRTAKAKVSTPRVTVRQKLEAYGKKKRWGADPKQVLERLLKQTTTRDVAKILGCTPESVRYNRDLLKIPRRPWGGHNIRAAAKKLGFGSTRRYFAARTGMPIKEMAQELGVPAYLVSRENQKVVSKLEGKST